MSTRCIIIQNTVAPVLVDALKRPRGSHRDLGILTGQEAKFEIIAREIHHPMGVPTVKMLFQTFYFFSKTWQDSKSMEL